MSPRELLAREVGGVITQIRMPLGGEEARDVPGVVAAHPEADAVERVDGAQVAVVHVGTVNLSQADDAAEEGAAIDLAARLDVNLSKTDTPAKVRIRRRHTADVSRQTEDLRDLEGDPSRGQVGFAADHANATVRTAVEEGVMDVDVFAETWVHPDEVASEADTTRLDRFATSSRVRPSPALRAEQFEELRHRVQSVRAATQPAEGTPPAVLSADGIVQVLREYWTDVEADAALSETTHADAVPPTPIDEAATETDEPVDHPEPGESGAQAAADGG
ncbi:hypothetical protein, partial [Candidatus Halobonum tyrrellensis]|uniref:hypothetical protein n=1 Tax=Candidatus Halobonum tyrrellensis TaxID=1431545 RepID=UPI0012680B6D